MWHETLISRLTERDAASAQFASVFASANANASKAAAAASRIVELEAQVAAANAIAADATRRLGQAELSGSPDAQRRYAEMEAKLAALKDEQRDMYKAQSQNAQRLLEYVETMKAHELAKKMMTDENAKLSAANSTLNVRLRDAFDLLKEKDGVIQILKDEMAALQLELVQREEQWKAAIEKAKKLEAENTELVDRWIKHKQEEAARMNEANEFVETALKHKQAETLKRNSSKDIQLEEALKPEKVVTCFPPTIAVKKMTLHDGEINCIQINKDGTLLATGGTDKKLILSDARTGATKSTLIGSLQAIMSVDFSRDGDSVMGTSNDNSVKIWSISTSRLRHTLTGHIGKVFSAKFTDSNRVVSGSHDRTLKVWDLNKGYCLKTIFTLSSCNDLDLLDGEGTLIVSGHLDNNLRVWDTRSGNLVREVTGIHSQQISGVTVSHNQNYLLTTSRDNILKLIDIRTFETVMSYANDNFRVGMNWSKSCFSSDGTYVASGSMDGSVFIWNRETGKTEKVLKEHKSSVCGVVWNPLGGANCYSIEKDKGVVLWGTSS
ncbi:hypothetical protein HDU79_006559 [Rhizoclosmatium sp. JEL0117]|nr:hypothetical protein HDU79_006559 [Rhizoclosmatium sp. JEL0117]